jgi:hypothetical protein
MTQNTIGWLHKNVAEDYQESHTVLDLKIQKIQQILPMLIS